MTKIIRRYDLVVDDGDLEHRTSHLGQSEARAAFLAAVARDPFSASVFGYDRDDNCVARVWHYDTNG